MRSVGLLTAVACLSLSNPSLLSTIIFMVFNWDHQGPSLGTITCNLMPLRSHKRSACVALCNWAIQYSAHSESQVGMAIMFLCQHFSKIYLSMDTVTANYAQCTGPSPNKESTVFTRRVLLCYTRTPFSPHVNSPFPSFALSLPSNNAIRFHRLTEALACVPSTSFYSLCSVPLP